MADEKMAELTLENYNKYKYTYGAKSITVQIRQLFQTHAITDKNKMFNDFIGVVDRDDKLVNFPDYYEINDLDKLLTYNTNSMDGDRYYYILKMIIDLKNGFMSETKRYIKANKPGRAEIYAAIVEININKIKTSIIIPDIDCFRWEAVDDSAELSNINNLNDAYPYRNDTKSMPVIGNNQFSCETIGTDINVKTHNIKIEKICEIEISGLGITIIYTEANRPLDPTKTYVCIGDITFLPQIPEAQQIPQVNKNAIIPDVSYFYWKQQVKGGSRRRTQKKRKSLRCKSSKKI